MEYYSTQNFPNFVGNHGAWDIYANHHGKCAAIPTDTGQANGNLPSNFGTLGYAMRTLGLEAVA